MGKIMGLPGKKVASSENELYVHQSSGLQVRIGRTAPFGQCNHPYI
jgi:hypothetical protein